MAKRLARKRRLEIWDSKAVTVEFEFEPRDVWLGLYWTRVAYAMHLYICLVPMVPLHITISRPYCDDHDEFEDPESWFCSCGSFNDHYWHCSSCGAEPPWGCDCGNHDEDDDDEEHVDSGEPF